MTQQELETTICGLLGLQGNIVKAVISLEAGKRPQIFMQTVEKVAEGTLIRDHSLEWQEPVAEEPAEAAVDDALLVQGSDLDLD
jgi:hypothetical protein